MNNPLLAMSGATAAAAIFLLVVGTAAAVYIAQVVKGKDGDDKDEK